MSITPTFLTCSPSSTGDISRSLVSTMSITSDHVFTTATPSLSTDGGSCRKVPHLIGSSRVGPGAEIPRQHNICKALTFTSRRSMGRASVDELNRQRELEAENAKAKRMYARPQS